MVRLILWLLLTVWSIASLMSLPEGNFLNRKKRIINGVPLREDNRYYKAVEWYVFMADAHDCSKIDTWSYHCAKPNNLRCGGSLLTPSIVQTACDCLAGFVGPRQENISTACILNNWEKLHVAFVGKKEVEKMTEGYMSTNFFIHARCGQLAVEPKYLTTHDYGLVKLARPVKLQGRLNFIQFAPIYSMSGLGRIYSYSTNNGVVCLTLGHGSTEIYPGTNRPSKEKSKTLRHSWAVLYDYVSCYWLTKIHNDTFPNYLDVATWTCLTRIPDDREKAYLTLGDLGSPVTCDGFYFGVASEHTHDLELSRAQQQDFVLQFAAAIAFTPYYNAIEFREEFERILNKAFWVPTFKPTFYKFKLMERGYQQNQARMTKPAMTFHLSIASSMMLFASIAL